MIVTNETPNSRYNNARVGAPKDDIPLAPDMDLGPLIQRWKLMRLEAMSKWYRQWRDLSRFINPSRGFFEGMMPNYNQQFDYIANMDASPAQNARILAAGMTSGLTSPSRPWFRLALENEAFSDDGNVKMWLEIVEKVIYGIFAKSNIYEAFQHTYEELGEFGTGAFGIFEDYNSVIRARSYTIGEYYLSIDAAGRVNGFARQYWMTAAQIVEEFGWKNCSANIQNAYTASIRDQYFLVYELIEKNDAVIEGMANFKGKKFRSAKWEATAPQNKALKISGYNEFPIMAPRWETTTTADIYGRGPGWYALGDIKSMYRMKKDLFLTTNKIADPPMEAGPGMETINTLPGGLSRRGAGLDSGLRPAWQPSGDPVSPLRLLIQEMKQSIASNFYADLFMMMINSPDGDKTAREIVERHDEKMLMLGPVLSRVEQDMLGPAITRTFEIAFRAKLIPPPPPEIQGQPIKIEYISILAQAQKMLGASIIEGEMAFVSNLMQAFPQMADVLDADEALREHAEINGAPRRIIRPPEIVAQIRQQRAQAQQAQAQQEQMAQAAQTAQTLSKTQVGDRSALDHIAGTEPSADGVQQ